MNCCDVEHIEHTALTDLETEELLPCMKCSHDSKAVSRRTVLFMVKPEFLEEALNGTFRFCPDRECAIVYFDEQGSRFFTVDDLRVPVGVKAVSDPIPVCYCFGFDETHLHEEILLTGTTTIPERISHLIREGLCACDVRNPSGKCCLGEVNRTAKRLKIEAAQRVKPRVVSRSMGETDHDSIVWDIVAVYQPGKLWQQAPPEPSYSSGPVVNVIDETRNAIKPELESMKQ